MKINGEEKVVTIEDMSKKLFEAKAEITAKLLRGTIFNLEADVKTSIDEMVECDKAIAMVVGMALAAKSIAANEKSRAQTELYGIVQKRKNELGDKLDKHNTNMLTAVKCGLFSKEGISKTTIDKSNEAKSHHHRHRHDHHDHHDHHHHHRRHAR
jgi:hypothetical protein